MKSSQLVKHRNQMYYDALDRLLDGRESPEYVKLRWKKRQRAMKETKR